MDAGIFYKSTMLEGFILEANPRINLNVQLENSQYKSILKEIKGKLMNSHNCILIIIFNFRINHTNNTHRICTAKIYDMWIFRTSSK